METIYETITEILRKNERASLATVVSKKGSTPARVGFKMIVLSNGDIIGTVGGGSIEYNVRNMAIDVMKSGKPILASFDLNDENSICGGKMEVFIEPIVQSEKLFIFGAGHVGQVLCKMASMVGFSVIIIDEREEYANKSIVPEVDQIIVSDFTNSFQHLEIDDSSFVVIMTRNHAFDETVLELACQTKAKYIGMIGSKKKVRETFDNLRKKGISEEKLSSIHSPIGLDIGSETPAEIAVSILAEMIQIRHGS
jgi:xanthine dehydrogenase accessory factor